MNELTIYNNHNLPATIEDLNKFILVGREKLTSVKAEIRAIKKLDMAQEVYLQKEEETRMLAEALLDAETRVGELLREIPKNQGKRTDLELIDTGVDKLKLKKEIIADLGFTQKQTERFETLAANKDLVEQVKEEARKNEDLPTRKQVLELAFKRKKEVEKQQSPSPFTEIDNHADSVANIGKKIITALGIINSLSITEDTLNLWYESLAYLNGDYAWELKKVRDAKASLAEMERFLMKQRGYTVVRHGKQD